MEQHMSCESEFTPVRGSGQGRSLPQRPGHSCRGPPPLALTSRAVSRKSYRPPVWMGFIMSRIRWISAPRCWILEDNHPHSEREKGAHQGQALTT